MFCTGRGQCSTSTLRFDLKSHAAQNNTTARNGHKAGLKLQVTGFSGSPWDGYYEFGDDVLRMVDAVDVVSALASLHFDEGGTSRNLKKS